MRKRGFIAYDPTIAHEHFCSDPIVTIYYLKLLRYDEILQKDRLGFFTRSARQIQEATAISERPQKRAREWLEANGYVQMMLRVPENSSAPQLHFKVLQNVLKD